MKRIIIILAIIILAADPLGCTGGERNPADSWQPVEPGAAWQRRVEPTLS